MKNIEIQYFAAIRDFAGKSSEQWQSNAANLAELYAELKEHYQIGIRVENIKVACNDNFVAMTDELRDGDKIVFIPPVAGG